MAVCQGSVLLALPLFALDLGAGIGVTALVFSLRGLGNMAIDLPAGWAVARFGDKAVMLAAVGLMLITALLASQATSPLQLGIAAFAFGSAVAVGVITESENRVCVKPHSKDDSPVAPDPDFELFFDRFSIDLRLLVHRGPQVQIMEVLERNRRGARDGPVLRLAERLQKLERAICNTTCLTLVRV